MIFNTTNGSLEIGTGIVTGGEKIHSPKDSEKKE
jgi:hypothetical protein